MARRLDADDASPNLDFAIIRLDRAAAPRFAPAALDLSRSTLPRGTHLTVIGFGSGIPAKIQGNPKSMVRDPRTDSGDWFMASTDTFAGNSGSGVFDTQTHALIGILDRGNGDDYVANRGCNIVNVCRGNQCGDENEEVNYLRPIVDALCEAQPDTALCAERTWQ